MLQGKIKTEHPRCVRGSGMAWDAIFAENIWLPILRVATDGTVKLGLLGGQRLHASIQAALVARSGVVMQNVLLHTLIQHGDGHVVLRLRSRHIVRLQSFAHGAQAVAELAAVGAVNGGALDGLTGAL